MQKVLEENAIEKRNNRRKTPTLLDGLLKCGDCGNSVTGKVKLYKGKRPDSKTYSCVVGLKKYQKQQDIDCANKRSLHMERTDAFVSDVVRRVLSDSSILKRDVQDRGLKRKEKPKVRDKRRGQKTRITDTEVRPFSLFH